jgi:hypothetical protein
MVAAILATSNDAGAHARANPKGSHMRGTSTSSLFARKALLLSLIAPCICAPHMAAAPFVEMSQATGSVALEREGQ